MGLQLHSRSKNYHVVVPMLGVWNLWVVVFEENVGLAHKVLASLRSQDYPELDATIRLNERPISVAIYVEAVKRARSGSQSPSGVRYRVLLVPRTARSTQSMLPGQDVGGELDAWVRVVGQGRIERIDGLLNGCLRRAQNIGRRPHSRPFFQMPSRRD